MPSGLCCIDYVWAMWKRWNDSMKFTLVSCISVALHLTLAYTDERIECMLTAQWTIELFIDIARHSNTIDCQLIPFSIQFNSFAFQLLEFICARGYFSVYSLTRHCRRRLHVFLTAVFSSMEKFCSSSYVCECLDWLWPTELQRTCNGREKFAWTNRYII